ncbi:ribbon-helix-helix domain-containing protein [uncultured Actinomyces sp.]|uniref:ribbon-helix-helix domain-containing protein n=1 Tax=uncultured Actinomyces sp. TaxID=249061 RepID=UPI0028E90B2A|nr:ribbon-helix-helix domain-containing protein [uncultured Actinomyces sp.]
MSERLLRGVPVTDEQIQVWADEAERGYDLAELPALRPGRPPVGKGPGVAVTVRLDEQTLRALMERAALEGISSRSDAIRAAVREWTHVA